MSTRKRLALCLVSGLILILILGPGSGSRNGSTAGAAEEMPLDPAAMADYFELKVRPVLAAYCWECHGPNKQKSGLRLDSREAILKGGETGPALVAGKPESSLLVEAIGYEGSVQMPPKRRLAKAEVDALAAWVKHGAPWPEARPGLTVRKPASVSPSRSSITAKDREFWSFRPVQDPPPPAVRDPAWPRSGIDQFILAKLESNSLRPARPADRQTLLRRVTFDLIGLPPSPEEIEAFLHDDSPRALEHVVDRLLASPHYGERWGRHWLDIARYGEDQAHSFQPRLYPQGYRYRDWLIQALNRDLPYNEFLIYQIAGDLIAGPGREERLPALGFFALGPVYYGDSQQHDQYADRIDTLCRGVLGLTVACARCHDHKYDPIPTTDYYALEGVFASSDYLEAPSAPLEQVRAYDNAQEAIRKKTQEINSYLKSEADRLKLKVPKNQVEKSLPDESRKKLKGLREELDRLKKALPPKYPVIHTLTDGKEPRNMRLLVRGNPETPGAEVARRFLSVLGGEDQQFAHGSGRLELAQAIASPSNSLTARVLVNRVWQHHFGRGLVATPSNFGTLGERPSHPELLDWLASRFVRGGWSIKRLHREILLSATYQQSSELDERAQEIDPGNTLLWRMNRRRLEVEAWRDAMLAVSGRLDPAVGGSSVGLDTTGNHRRTCYAAISRHDLAPLLRLFDFPDPNITSGGRLETTVALQQLFVLNSEFMVQTARSLARRLETSRKPGEEGEARIRRAYVWLYGRQATPREIALGRAFLEIPAESSESRSYAVRTTRQEGTAARAGQALPEDLSRWERYAQALLAANEFMYVD